jgi:hypothetical protein
MLDISSNYLSGPTNINFQNLVLLQYLFIGHNLLEGSFPRSISHATTMEILSTEYNYVCGNLSIALSSLNVLVSLKSNSNLSGRIPFISSNHSFLTDLLLANNHFSGPIPAELGYLPRLVYFVADSNLLSSSIPIELSYSRNLSVIHISYNELTGTIPARIFQTNIDDFDGYASRMAGLHTLCFDHDNRCLSLLEFYLLRYDRRWFRLYQWVDLYLDFCGCWTNNFIPRRFPWLSPISVVLG